MLVASAATVLLSLILNATRLWPFTWRWRTNGSVAKFAILARDAQLAAIALWAIHVVLLVPEIEKILFRFGVLSYFTSVTGKSWIGVLISAALFSNGHLGACPIWRPAAAHANNSAWLFMASIVLGLVVVRRRGTLGLAIAIHVPRNATEFASTALGAESASKSPRRLRRTGPNAAARISMADIRAAVLSILTSLPKHPSDIWSVDPHSSHFVQSERRSWRLFLPWRCEAGDDSRQHTDPAVNCRQEDLPWRPSAFLHTDQMRPLGEVVGEEPLPSETWQCRRMDSLARTVVHQTSPPRSMPHPATPDHRRRTWQWSRSSVRSAERFVHPLPERAT